jgi:thymidine kinase
VEKKIFVMYNTHRLTVFKLITIEKDCENMAKLYFRYGSMGSSKTANALMVKYNYEERGQKVVFLKPEIDNRDGEDFIKSRTGIESKITILPTEASIVETSGLGIPEHGINCIIIDESQFLSKIQVWELCNIVDNMNVPVVCYGLRTDFLGNLFEGSQWLLAWSDSVEEIKTICFCGKKAIMNMRICEGKPVYRGEQILIGGNDSYISVCRKHYNRGEYKQD